MSMAWRRIDFDDVRIEAGPGDHGALLVVSGIKHWLNLIVNLMPRCYHARPAFWVIEVVGALPGYGVPALVDFSVVLPLHGLRGVQGIEIVGATKSERRFFTNGDVVIDIGGAGDDQAGG
ncbi:MAG: hypothetical protein ABI831_18755 [Betaproteobacteria bacterium]